MKLVAILFLAASMTSFSICWATELPNQTDLKAAYCLRILDYQFHMLKTTLDTETPIQQQMAREAAKIARSELQRIKSYLLPRFPYLEATGMIFANNSAQRDIELMEANVSACFDKCGQNIDCISNLKCLSGTSEAESRIATCRGTRFLPF